MANHISSKKRIRRNSRMETVNKVRKNRVRSFIKKVEWLLINLIRH
jgi:ribosomal protein S20